MQVKERKMVLTVISLKYECTTHHCSVVEIKLTENKDNYELILNDGKSFALGIKINKCPLCGELHYLYIPFEPINNASQDNKELEAQAYQGA